MKEMKLGSTLLTINGNKIVCKFTFKIIKEIPKGISFYEVVDLIKINQEAFEKRVKYLTPLKSNETSFIYKWINNTNGRKYIGYHKGQLNDYYICSAQNKDFWKDFFNIEHRWTREILFVGPKTEMAKQEILLLKQNRALLTNEYYNGPNLDQLEFPFWNPYYYT